MTFSDNQFETAWAAYCPTPDTPAQPSKIIHLPKPGAVTLGGTRGDTRRKGEAVGELEQRLQPGGPIGKHDFVYWPLDDSHTIEISVDRYLDNRQLLGAHRPKRFCESRCADDSYKRSGAKLG